jgi:hypothetical protein
MVTIYPKVGAIRLPSAAGGCNHLTITCNKLAMPRLMYFFFVVDAARSDLPSISMSAPKVNFKTRWSLSAK